MAPRCKAPLRLGQSPEQQRQAVHDGLALEDLGRVHLDNAAESIAVPQTLQHTQHREGG